MCYLDMSFFSAKLLPLKARLKATPCRDAAGLLVAMARSSHQDAEDQVPQEMYADQHQAGSVQFEAQDQPHLQAQNLAAG